MTPMKIICQLLLLLSAVTAECPAGYEEVDSKCIHRFNGGYLTYDAAVDYCRQQFGRLPVIDDCSTFTEVATFVDDGYSAEASKGFWLGATYSSRDGVWRWSDGAAVPMGAPYWAFNAPAKAGREPAEGTRSNCAVIYPAGNWAVFDTLCGATNVYPICSRTPLHGHCGQPFVSVGTQCVHVIQAGSTWAAARTQCGLLGGDLIILDDCHQYRKVYLYLTEKGYKPYAFWIGASDLAVEGQWRWIDGSPMAMGVPYWGNMHGGAPEPNNPGVENCMELSSAWMYRFSNTLCNNTRRVVCETHPL